MIEMNEAFYTENVIWTKRGTKRTEKRFVFYGKDCQHVTKEALLSAGENKKQKALNFPIEQGLDNSNLVPSVTRDSCAPEQFLFADRVLESEEFEKVKKKRKSNRMKIWKSCIIE